MVTQLAIVFLVATFNRLKRPCSMWNILLYQFLHVLASDFESD